MMDRQFRIVTDKSASLSENTAAGELRAWLEKAGFVVGEAGTTIRVGGPVIPELGDDGYTISINGDEININGGKKRGTLYGAYTFLEKYIGWRWYADGVERLVPAELPDRIELTEKPVFAFRDSFWDCYIRHPIFGVRQKINSGFGRVVPAEFGGDIRYARQANCHTFDRLLPWEEYFDEHPEYYAMIDGKRDKRQLCLTNPEVLRLVTENVKKWIKEDPDAGMISVTQNDNMDYCTCDDCAKVDSEEESHAGTMLRFVNAIADEVKKDYPDWIVDTFAYQYTRKAPKLTVPRDNVAIRLCSIECCFSHPLDDGDCEINRAFVKDIEDWNRICDRLYIWDYTTDFSYYVTSFPNFGVLAPNVRFYADHHVTGLFEQGEYQSQSGEFGELRSYLLAKLLWDPYMSEAELKYHFEDFLEGYYGAGWKNIEEYIRRLQALITPENHVRIFDNPKHFLRGFRKQTDELEALWDAAEKEAGDAVERVRCSRIQMDYIKLNKLWYDREDRRQGSPEAFSEYSKKVNQALKKYAVRFNEGRDIFDEYQALENPTYLWRKE